jgi:hypothetical protein
MVIDIRIIEDKTVNWKRICHGEPHSDPHSIVITYLFELVNQYIQSC